MTPRWTIALEWMLATVVALGLADLLVEILAFAVLGMAMIVFLPLLGGAMLGFPVGALQWLVLRRHVSESGGWMLATGAGFTGAWLLGITLAFVAASGRADFGAFWALGATTPVVGLAQAAILRRWTSRAGFWVLASALGWTAFVAVEVFGARSLSVVSDATGRLVSWIAGYAVTSSVGATLLGGAFAGGITGVSLLWVLRSPPRS